MSSEITSVAIGAMIALSGTAFTGILAWRMQRRSNDHALNLQQKRIDYEETIRRRTLHRQRGEELYSANSNMRDDLRSTTTAIVRKIELGTVEFWDTEQFFTAGRDSLARLSLLVQLDYAMMQESFERLTSAFKELSHTKLIDAEGKIPDESAGLLMANMRAYAQASQLFSSRLVAEMKNEGSADPDSKRYQ